MQRVSRAVLSEQYTGSNGAAVLAMCQTITQYTGNVWSLVSDDGQTLVLMETSPIVGRQSGTWPIEKGQWVVVAPDTGIIARIPDALYQVRYKAIDSIVGEAVAANVAAIAASAPVQNAIIAEVGKAMYGGFGVAALPLLLGGAQAVAQVTILPAQPDTGYVARAFAVSGAAVLTALEIVSITKVSGSVATVTVRNTGAASVGGLLLVHITSPVGGASKA